MKNYKFLQFSVFLILSLSGYAQYVKPNVETLAEYEIRVRQTLALDYSMPDYSVTKINAKVMGPRLAAMLTSLEQNYNQYAYKTAVSHIQASQIEGLRYVNVNKMTLANVTKSGREITVTYKTLLDANPLNIKNAQFTFSLVDGISNNKDVNELLYNLCRYIR